MKTKTLKTATPSTVILEAPKKRKYRKRKSKLPKQSSPCTTNIAIGSNKPDDYNLKHVTEEKTTLFVDDLNSITEDNPNKMLKLLACCVISFACSCLAYYLFA